MCAVHVGCECGSCMYDFCNIIYTCVCVCIHICGYDTRIHTCAYDARIHTCASDSRIHTCASDSRMLCSHALKRIAWLNG